MCVNIGLCRFLQSDDIDLKNALDEADKVLGILNEMRDEADSEFAVLFSSVSELCAELGISIEKPRLAKRQTARCNIQTDSVESYFKVAIFIPFVDNFCVHLNDRLLAHRNILSSFLCLVPRKIVARPTPDQLTQMRNLCTTYAEDLQIISLDVALAELALWFRQLSKSNTIPKTAIEAYLLCNGTALPCIKKLLQIMVTLPVTTCTSERSFSTLRRLKTYLRSTMGSDRLNGLALLNIHRDIPVQPSEIIEKLCEKPRRLPFRLM